MKAEIVHLTRSALSTLEHNRPWMSWNLFLALVPLGLSFWLFRPWAPTTNLGSVQSNLRHWASIRLTLWVLGFLTFVAFLPNAPYVLTDAIHLARQLRYTYSNWIITLVLLPQFFLFMFLGFEAYVLSLLHLGRFMRRQGWGRYVLSIELVMHALSAFGVYLGRFQRFNSWDILAQPHSLAEQMVDSLLGKRPLLVTGVTFGVIATLYWLMKHLNLAVLTYWKMQRQGSPQEAQAIAK